MADEDKMAEQLPREIPETGATIEQPREVDVSDYRNLYEWVFDKVEEAKAEGLNLCALKEVVKNVIKHLY